MSQFDEFLKEVEGLTEKEIKVLVVTGKPGSGKSKVLREAAETKGWIILIPVCLLRKIS